MESNESCNLLDEVPIILKDIGYSVASIELSQILPNRPDLLYLNIRTKENNDFCIRLSVNGFQVAGHSFNLDEGASTEFPEPFETVYALLQSISPSYVQSFGNALLSKLLALDKDKL